jgi:hypothetical protein
MLPYLEHTLHKALNFFYAGNDFYSNTNFLVLPAVLMLGDRGPKYSYVVYHIVFGAATFFIWTDDHNFNMKRDFAVIC